MSRIELIGLEEIGEVHPGASVGRLISQACSRQKIALSDDDVLVIAHKIVSKAEGRILGLETIQPSRRAVELARELDKEPALVQVILDESRRVIRSGGHALIVETHHGFICANAGV
ncbi:MAG TPA: coenzyme F420-0:L-glutamate ligase, partial [Candidatus Eisenbacteria bacterium]|nr:coenzyme F420-0:L-glutamate ligase [Candidatus Eisenbacteria bacterium]